MPKKLMRCVRKLKKKKGVKSAWAICIASTGQKPHKSKKSKSKRKKK